RSARWVSKSTMGGPSSEIGEDRRRRLHDVADGGARLRVGRQVDVDTRAEADEAVARAARDAIAGLDVAEDAPRDEPRDLHDGDVDALAGAKVQRVALVGGRRLVERGVDERAGLVPDVHHFGVDRAAVRVDV